MTLSKLKFKLLLIGKIEKITYNKNIWNLDRKKFGP